MPECSLTPALLINTHSSFQLCDYNPSIIPISSPTMWLINPHPSFQLSQLKLPFILRLSWHTFQPCFAFAFITMRVLFKWALKQRSYTTSGATAHCNHQMDCPFSFLIVNQVLIWKEPTIMNPNANYTLLMY